MGLALADSQYKGGHDVFAKHLAELTSCFSALNAIQSHWMQQLKTLLAEPFEEFAKRAFTECDDARKACKKARSNFESADKAKSKGEAREQSTPEEKVANLKARDEAQIQFKMTTAQLLDRINDLDARKEIVFIDQIRQFAEESTKCYAAGQALLQDRTPVFKAIQARSSERRRIYNNFDRALFKTAYASINAFKRETLLATHELEKQMRLQQPLTDLEREELMQPPPPLSPFAKDKCGWINKKAGKSLISKWDRRFAVLKNGQFRLYRDLKADIADHSASMDCLVTNVKSVPAGETNKPWVFQMVGIERTYVLQADSEEEMHSWLTCIQNATAAALASAESASSASAKGNNSSPLKEGLLRTDELEAALFRLWDTPGNEVCCDCFSARPQWVSLNFGALICIECSGVHRNLGVHLSKVRSFRLDDWYKETMAYLLHMGNDKVNSLYEENEARRVKFKPTDESNSAMREVYIKKKYQGKACLRTLPEAVANPDALGRMLFNAAVEGDCVQILRALALGADINWTSTDSSSRGATALHAAVAHEHTLAATCLVLNSAALDVRNSDGRTPLHLAAMTGSIDTVKLLLRNDAKLGEKDVTSKTPLDLANTAGKEDISEFMQRLNAPASVPFDPEGGPIAFAKPEPLVLPDEFVAALSQPQPAGGAESAAPFTSASAPASPASLSLAATTPEQASPTHGRTSSTLGTPPPSLVQRPGRSFTVSAGNDRAPPPRPSAPKPTATAASPGAASPKPGPGAGTPGATPPVKPAVKPRPASMALDDTSPRGNP